MSSTLAFRGMLVAVLPFGLTAWLQACGGETGDGTGTADVPASEFPEALARAYCGNLGPCCSAAARPFKQQNCEVILAQFYRVALEQNGIEQYDTANSGECLDAIAAATRQCNFDEPDGLDGACAGIVSGSSRRHGAAGDPCEETCSDRGSVTICSSWGSADEPDAGAGGELLSCYTNDGVYCEPSTNRCAPQTDVGSPCDVDEQCRDAYCDGTVCTARRAQGEPCSGGAFDATCLDGLYCGDAATCVPAKPDGQPCEWDDECAGGNCNDGTCGASFDTFLALACAG